MVVALLGGAERRVVYGRGAILVVAWGARVRAAVEVLAARGRDARGLLRVGVDAVRGRLVGRPGRDRHAVDVAVNHRVVRIERFLHVAARRELRERAVARSVLRVVVGRLARLDFAQVLERRRLVGGAHSALPGGYAYGDEYAYDRDDDHQLDERESRRPPSFAV